ncbi:MAG: hypothetical protein ACO1N7_00265 [Sphingobacteriaceae bacterium]
MLKFFIFIIASCYSFGSFSQSGKSLVVTAGPSFPLGDFAKKDLGSDAGQANTGAFVDLAYNFPIKRNLSGVALLRGKIYGVDLSNFKAPSGTGAIMNIESGVWKSLSLMAGLSRSLQLNESRQNAFEIRALIGAQRTVTPKIKAWMSVPNMEVYSGNQEPKGATALAYMIGASFKRELNTSIALKISADISGSNPVYKTEIDPTRNPDPMYRETTITSKQKTTSLDLGAGLIIRL